MVVTFSPRNMYWLHCYDSVFRVSFVKTEIQHLKGRWELN